MDTGSWQWPGERLQALPTGIRTVFTDIHRTTGPIKSPLILLAVPIGFCLINRQGLSLYFRRFRGGVIWAGFSFSIKQQ